MDALKLKYGSESASGAINLHWICPTFYYTPVPNDKTLTNVRISAFCVCDWRDYIKLQNRVMTIATHLVLPFKNEFIRDLFVDWKGELKKCF